MSWPTFALEGRDLLLKLEQLLFARIESFTTSPTHSFVSGGPSIRSRRRNPGQPLEDFSLNDILYRQLLIEREVCMAVPFHALNVSPHNGLATG